MATHHVSLFLPETVAFHKPPSSAARRSSTPPPTADLRRGSSVDLPLRPPSLSILNGPTPPRTPSITDDIFASKPGTDKLLSREPGDPRSLVHSDAHVPDWGVQAIFNQPKSRAGLLPSASILDFARVHEEVVKEREEARRAATKRISPTSRSSRAGSHDRSYEGKEWTVKPAIQGNGGLTNAVRAVAESDETEIHWIGTIGFPTDTLPQALKEDIHDKMVIDHNSQVIFPLIFLKQDIGFSQYMALLTVADVLIISALRDGMNLTAHEYIYCQDGKGWTGREKRHGPLILSEFTGSAAVFGGPQISINPWDYQQHANAIKEALEMGDAEKTARWTKLHKTVTTQTGGHWAHHLSLALDKVYNEHSQRASQSVPRLSVQRLADKYRAAAQRVFVLDYEGTLAPHRTSTGIPLSSPQRVLDALEGLMADARNIVYIMSGREPEELEALFRTLPALGLIAENGCFVREYGGGGRGEAHAEWQQFPDADGVAVWKDQVRGNLGYYGDRLEGSYVEERHCSLLFRYEKAGDQEAAVRFAGEAADQINSACRFMRIHAVPISKAVLIEQMDFSKRSAASRIFDLLRASAIEAGTAVSEFLLVAGDDREDEVVFEWANGLATSGVVRDVFTVSVGRRNTVACATLTQGATGLLTALQRLGRTGGGGGVEGEYFGRGRGAATSPGE
ncbi:Trehalose-6-P synthase/phosphatase complex subunit [Rachicladosporium monterosium]|uniref:Trehalose-6-P synthase/phosphatase complex subunit n=1 Tax=Rachicladosporium monterosium TaxID=1507873 RepID=A0ABR0LC40_9PEZI|nr:Trehalose-6-P synthase/phosphatase complex subunit [Rachicladosporium monterosium]